MDEKYSIKYEAYHYHIFCFFFPFLEHFFWNAYKKITLEQQEDKLVLDILHLCENRSTQKTKMENVSGKKQTKPKANNNNKKPKRPFFKIGHSLIYFELMNNLFQISFMWKILLGLIQIALNQFKSVKWLQPPLICVLSSCCCLQSTYHDRPLGQRMLLVTHHF